MVVAPPEPKPDLQRPVGEQRVVLQDVTWGGYLQILGALPPRRGSRLTYDDGVLEITVPLEEHEFSANNIAYFLLTLVELMGLKLKSMGSTTMNYPGLQKGAEPDKAFYIQNQARVAGRNVDFSQDPPPDLVVEVDITHTDILKNQFYARLGVPEFWRFDGKVLRIYQLQDAVYVEVERSPTFPLVPKEWLYQFLDRARLDEIAAVQELRSQFQKELT
ncbi:Uma2 family endonuclease [filamentous cyanobacterium LEGE 11480]|uniref:Uma2 family endonuclease n=1 Tax=Romeriopsis navalis LEGE 11480 TaxID=2777977 RepID=A0A928VSS9_9CYAN|nr:Uma2 family endonuclease [Romeriopsis navalis]MBE9031885.1 Uma2 family endonuclease [Romeriopsis navalis LEGE 11480]